MKYSLILIAVLMTGCANSNYSTHLKTGCIWSCDEWEQHLKKTAQMKVDEKASQDRRQAERLKQEAEHQARLDKIKAEHQAKLNQCSSKSRMPMQVSDAVRVGVEARYKLDLKDPYSARFRNIQEASAWDQCMGRNRYIGEVNAKNSYGGYTGYQSFSTN